ncbi:MAG: argininosuccinate lyase [Oscillospiraceae bacterium]|jgi:argininosuccinate lyase|nr:argininosuccinate lyase [Oscillospiraceae bacterium]
MSTARNGRFGKEVDKSVNDFNTSLPFDQRMWREDITGSLAHAAMLAKQGVITEESHVAITRGLNAIAADIEAGALIFDGSEAEDIHMFVEEELTQRIGAAGKELHTARSRNDQVATDLRLYLRKELDLLKESLLELTNELCDKAEEHAGAIMPGYTHLQRAQPVSFGHHLMAYAAMFCRHLERIADYLKRLNVCPLGSAALAGTSYDIDRFYTAASLQFDKPCGNSIDGVGSRDFVIEYAYILAQIMADLSRFCEEIILWSSHEFKFVTIDDAYSTGSSIMPQKKNPDVAELIRGKSGRVFGNLFALFTMVKGTPLAYNKDLQEDKEAVFDSIDTVKLCLGTFTPMLKTLTINADNMLRACNDGFINATDCADYLTGKGIPFREAYGIVGELVRYASEHGLTLDTLPFDVYQSKSSLFDKDIFSAIGIRACFERRTSYGGTHPNEVKRQITETRELLEKYAKD